MANPLLLVESRSEYRKQMVQLLNYCIPGLKIEAPEDTAKAIDWLRRNTPSAVVLDGTLSDNAAIQILKESPQATRKYPILITILDLQQKTVDSWLNLGADDFILKPLDEGLFRTKAKAMVNKPYGSSYYFYGAEDGLSPVVFTLPSEIEILTEDEITFLAPVLINRETRIKIQIGELRVPAVVRDISKTAGFGELVYSTTAQLETTGQFELQVAIRRYIRELSHQGKPHVP